MKIKTVTSQEYDRLLGHPYHVFNSAEFNVLNQHKCDRLEFLVFEKKNKIKLGIIIGSVDNIYKSPFSAPFGGFSFINEKISLKQIEEAVDILDDYCRGKGAVGIEYTQPPLFYAPTFISKVFNVLHRKAFKIRFIDLNYSLNLENFNMTEVYSSNLMRNAKKNLKRALKSELIFFRCEEEKEIEKAYKIIESNRKSKGYPLRMSFEEVKATIKNIAADFFLVARSNVNIAAAQVFHVGCGIVQVIYWGDCPGYENYRPINFLSHKICQYYKNLNIKIIDIGPSTEKGLPNHGLCEFKESIGAEVFSKISFKKTL